MSDMIKYDWDLKNNKEDFRMRKKVVSLALAAIMVVGTIFINGVPAGAAEEIKSVTVTKTPYEDTIKDNDGKIIKTISLEKPVLEGSGEGVSAINKYYESFIETMKKSAHEEVSSEGLTAETPGSFSGTCEVTYNRNGIICILYKTYSYTGGAHGMPYWIPTTFDLNTGKLLEAKDIFNFSDSEFNKLITHKFKLTFERNPELYFEDALSTVKSTASLGKTPFYLKDKNACFFFDPYAVAPYSTGFVGAGFSYDRAEWFKISLK